MGTWSTSSLKCASSASGSGDYGDKVWELHCAGYICCREALCIYCRLCIHLPNSLWTQLGPPSLHIYKHLRRAHDKTNVTHSLNTFHLCILEKKVKSKVRSHFELLIWHLNNKFAWFIWNLNTYRGYNVFAVNWQCMVVKKHCQRSFPAGLSANCSDHVSQNESGWLI